MSASMSIGSVGLGSTSNALASVFNSSTSGDTTNVTTLPDGSTVTTVRDKKGDIVSIATTPRTRPPEPGSASASPSASGGINLLA
ncbi:hypothetical protein [Acidocella sp. MX-AZ02]|uniref:hypothetical protein n=1 Tax=Acidocella sp. MX-AZ02 TaxID=1214225 RepID=UPI00028D3320|nr:hypothetical protein [Acidocella sp. MX-AZ02]EKN00871.1 hypothetical protein MXAZACID_03247 [Acidocella sp. MX-AZ02]